MKASIHLLLNLIEQRESGRSGRRRVLESSPGVGVSCRTVRLLCIRRRRLPAERRHSERLVAERKPERVAGRDRVSVARDSGLELSAGIAQRSCTSSARGGPISRHAGDASGGWSIQKRWWLRAPHEDLHLVVSERRVTRSRKRREAGARPRRSSSSTSTRRRAQELVHRRVVVLLIERAPSPAAAAAPFASGPAAAASPRHERLVVVGGGSQQRLLWLLEVLPAERSRAIRTTPPHAAPYENVAHCDDNDRRAHHK